MNEVNLETVQDEDFGKSSSERKKRSSNARCLIKLYHFVDGF